MNTNAKNTFIYYLIIISSIARCIIASGIELGNDEAYYYTYALHLQASYFDHPPLVALFIRLFTFNLSFDNEIFIRLTSIVCAAFNTALIYKLLSKIKNTEAGIFSALLYNACIYTSVISGIFILPDSPQVVFWLLSIYLLIKIFILHEQEKLNICLFGITAALCTLCKIHGLYLWFAGGLFIFFFERKWIHSKYLWLSIFTSSLIISPIFIWNYRNNFITYNYHSQRVTANGGIHISSFIREIGGEIFYANPIIFVLIVIAIISVFTRKLFVADKKLFALLLLLSMPLLCIFWCISLFRNTLPHWCGPAYITLIIFTAYYSDEVFFNRRKLLNAIHSSNAFLLGLLIAGFLCINYLPVQFGKTDTLKLGSGDFTLDVYGWKDFEMQFKKIVENDIASKNMRADAILISNKWFPAAHLNYYVARPLHKKLYAFGPLFDIHHFAWLNHFNGAIKAGTDAYYIAPSNYSSNPIPFFSNYFKTIESPVTVPQYRRGKLVRNFYVFRLKHYIQK